MKTRLIVPAVLSVVMLSTPVLAAGNYGTYEMSTHPAQKTTTMTLAQKCASLENQFDAAIKTHEKGSKAIDAKTMRTEGGSLCDTGKRADGIAKLEQALKDLGVKAKS